jgi:predicted Zn-dependent protease
VIRLAPDDAAGWGQLGKLHLITLRLDDAEHALQEALNRRPGYPAYVGMMAEVLRQRGTTDAVARSIPLFKEALAARPGDATLQHRLGLAYQNQGDLDRAADALAASTRLAPDYPDPYYLLSQVQRRLGNVSEAQRALARFQALQARLAASEAGDGSGPVPAEVPRLEGGATKVGEAAPLIAEARRLFYNEGQPDAAAERLGRALEAQPNHPDGHYQLGLVMVFLGRKPEAMKEFRRAASLDGANPRYHAWIGTLQLELGPSHLPEALETLRRSVRLGPDYAYGHYQLGRALLSASRSEEAEAPLARAVRLDPTYREAFYSLWQVRARQGKRKEAADALARFRRLDAFERERRGLSIQVRAAPSDPEPRLKLAGYLLNYGQRGQAELVLEGLLQVCPRHPRAEALLARLRSARGG